MSTRSTACRRPSRSSRRPPRSNPRSTVGTVTEIYDYMRLLWARVGIPYSPATGLPIESQTVSQMVDRVLALPERHAALPARARGARPQGRVPQGTRRLPEARLPARQDRRRVLRDRGRAGARQEVQARHRRGGGPHRGAPGHRQRGSPKASRRRSSWPTASPCGSPSAGRTRRTKNGERQSALIFSAEVRLPGLRLHDSGDRAAAVLVQQPVRRLPGLRRPRRRAWRSTPTWSCRTTTLTLRRRRDRAVGEVDLALLRPDAGGAGASTTSSRSTRRGRSCRRSAQDVILYGTGEDDDPLRPMTTACAPTR